MDFSLLVLVHKYLGCQHPFGGFFLNEYVVSFSYFFLISFHLKSILPYVKMVRPACFEIICSEHLSPLLYLR